MPVLQTIVPASLDGRRLDHTLAILFPAWSRSCLQRQIRQNRVWINMQSIQRPREIVRVGQVICLESIATSETKWEAQSIHLEICYEDEALLIIHKPAGLVVHPAPGHPNHTLINALLYHHPPLNQLPRMGLIHRLDKDTSGLLVVAKTQAAYTVLIRQLAARQIERCYLTLCRGRLISGGRIDQPIGRHPYLRQKRAVTATHGKTAISDYRVLERFSRYSLLEVRLTTGRTHQIRVHMAHLQHPIVGDPLYGGRIQTLSPSQASSRLGQALQQFNRQALHAYSLALSHPTTQSFHCWKTPLPQDMQQLLDYLRTDMQE